MMESVSRNQQDPYWAHIAPFAVFMLIMAVPDLFTFIGQVPEAAMLDTDVNGANGSVWAHRQLWLYPLQTVVCLALLIFYRRCYPWNSTSGIGVGLLAGVLGIAVWILPSFLFQRFQIVFPLSEMFGLVDRSEGFNAVAAVSDQPLAAFWFWTTRLLRLIVVVPIMEEVFWRSFLMRFLADSKTEFNDSPFGQHSTIALVVVTAMFAAAHQPADYVGAIGFGLLAYWVTVKTKSLWAVIAMHAMANACLAAYAVTCGQWGFL